MCPACGQRMPKAQKTKEIAEDYVKICKDPECGRAEGLEINSAQGREWIELGFYRNAATPDGFDYYCKRCRDMKTRLRRLKKYQEKVYAENREETRQWKKRVGG
jgi:hypothetical protein